MPPRSSRHRTAQGGGGCQSAAWAPAIPRRAGAGGGGGRGAGGWRGRPGKRHPGRRRGRRAGCRGGGRPCGATRARAPSPPPTIPASHVPRHPGAPTWPGGGARRRYHRRDLPALPPWTGAPRHRLTRDPALATVTSPAHRRPRPVTITTPAGTSNAETFTFEAPLPPGPPTITKLIPTSGPDTGGTTVDIIGTDLTGATAVDFGGTAGTGLTVDPSGSLATVTSPAHTAGPAPVTITTPAGTSNAETFTFEAPPVVTVPVIYASVPVIPLCRRPRQPAGADPRHLPDH
ncbi:MAG: IPT/TIG domain-containing protein [Candidatus Microthrix sp.]|nr:IPT/TIG domain-containing protein [Candidatus Microthrix sp.]